MAIIKPRRGNNQVKKHGGKGHGRQGGFRGGKGGFGGGMGGGGGQWMFIPAGSPAPFFGGGQRFGNRGPQRFAPAARFGAPMRAFGRKGGGKAGGQKHANQDPKQRKALDKLQKIEAERKVWIGGLAKDTKRGALYAHFKDTCKPHLFELMSKGTACVAFKTAEDAQTAIDTFNGSEIDGKEIQVDVWTQKEKKERPPKMKGSVLKTSFLKGRKGKKANKVESPNAAKIKAVEPALKAWIGGLSEKTTPQQLKKHFAESGCEVDMCDLMKKGTACCTFKTEDEATSAIASVNGTELQGKTIEVDVWTKPERKEKKKKEIKEETE